MAQWLIISLARKLGISPLFSQLVLLAGITIGFGFANPQGWRFFEGPGILIWGGICGFVVLITWAMQGEYRKYWTDAEFWKK
jgi:hypothetical protein